MFSRDDLGKGTAHPLIWVFGPLVLGALLITGLGIAARATQGFPDIELADETEVASHAGDDRLLAEVTPFEWDRVCVAPPSTTKSEVDRLIGREWGVVGGDAPGRRVLLVFLRDGEVVRHFYLAPSTIARPPTSGDCRSPEDESTRL